MTWKKGMKAGRKVWVNDFQVHHHHTEGTDLIPNWVPRILDWRESDGEWMVNKLDGNPDGWYPAIRIRLTPPKRRRK